VRLSIPVLFSSIAVLVLSYISPTTYVLGGLYEHWNIFNGFRQESINFSRVLNFSFYQAFFNYNNETSLIPPAWTMRPEFLGSIFIYFFIYFIEKRNICHLNVRRILVAGCLLILTYGYFPLIYYFSFFSAGALIAISSGRVKMFCSLWWLICLLFLRSAQIYFGYKGFMIDFIFGCAIVYFIKINQDIEKFFQKNFFIFLGKISFPLYLLHYAVFMYISVPLFKFIESYAHISYELGVLIVSALSFFALFLLSYLFTYIDFLSIYMGRKIKLYKTYTN
jgi:peptidoglycan/LPS O-acetylase OafA/YrhL